MGNVVEVLVILALVLLAIGLSTVAVARAVQIVQDAEEDAHRVE
ncbi:MAG: hypothetical protein AAFZ07_09955 [Actinomycetota bacterium]